MAISLLIDECNLSQCIRAWEKFRQLFSKSVLKRILRRLSGNFSDDGWRHAYFGEQALQQWKAVSFGEADDAVGVQHCNSWSTHG